MPAAMTRSNNAPPTGPRDDPRAAAHAAGVPYRVRVIDGETVLSPSDLVSFAACADPAFDLLLKRGKEHEERYPAELEVSASGDPDEGGARRLTRIAVDHARVGPAWRGGGGARDGGGHEAWRRRHLPGDLPSTRRRRDLASPRARRRDPGLHVFHYNHYGPTALRKLMSRHSTREAEVDAFVFRSPRDCDRTAACGDGCACFTRGECQTDPAELADRLQHQHREIRAARQRPGPVRRKLLDRLSDRLTQPGVTRSETRELRATTCSMSPILRFGSR